MQCIRVHNSQFSPAGAVSLLVFSDTQLEIEGSYSWEVCKLGTLNLYLSNLGENQFASTGEMHFQCRCLSIS